MTSIIDKVIFLGFILASGLCAHGGNCDQLQPLPGSSLQYTERGNRCEGLYVADVGAKTIELVSFTQGRLDYQLKHGIKLQVTPLHSSGSVHIRAVAIPARTYYRMDANVESGSVLLWPVDEVLLPENLSAERIGVFAWSGGESARIFTPVLVTTPGSVTTTQPTAENAYLTVRPSFDVEALKWRSSVLRNGACVQAGSWADALSDGALAWQPLKIILSGLRGQHCIEIAAQSETSNDWATITFRVELPE